MSSGPRLLPRLWSLRRSSDATSQRAPQAGLAALLEQPWCTGVHGCSVCFDGTYPAWVTLRLESCDILNGKWISQKYIHVSPNPCNGSF